MATIGCILPSCILVTILARFYLRYRNMDLLQGVLGTLRPAVVALIGSSGVLMLISAFWGSVQQIAVSQPRWSMVIIFLLCFWLLWKKKKNPVFVMILAGIMNVAWNLLKNLLLLLER